MDKRNPDVLSFSKNLQFSKLSRVLLEQNFFEPIQVRLLAPRLNENCKVHPSSVLS
jgi:hypothetical protein